nr:hypothetical protein [Tanacetum cinerariifolium]
LLNRHQIFLHPSCIDEVAMVELADASALYLSLKPHYDEAGEDGFSYRVSGTQEWQFQKTKEFLAWLRTRLGLPADLAATDEMRLPFGKYKAAFAQDIVMRDPVYCAWLLTDSYLADNKKKYLAQLLEETGHKVPDYAPAVVYSYHQVSAFIKAASEWTKVKFVEEETRVLVYDISRNAYQHYQLAQPCYKRLLEAVRPTKRGGKIKLRYTQPEACAALEVQEFKDKLQLLIS